MLCCVYNFAPSYREGIFTLMDQTYDIAWFFGRKLGDIKGMDVEKLKNATLVDNKTVFKAPLYWQPGVVKQLWKKNNTAFLMLGQPHCLSTWAVLALKNLFFRQKKVYLWSHGWYGRETRLKKVLKHMFFGMADGEFTYGDRARKLMIENGFRPEKISAIHNSLKYDEQLELRKRLSPTDIYARHFNNPHKTLIFIGRLTEVKHLDQLMVAVKKLRERGEYYNLVLVGDGAKADELRRLDSDLGLNTWFYGPCYDDHENAELIYNADLCVSPGNVGLTSVHTMTFGTPVITHDNFNHQMPEFEAIRDGETGTFFTYMDVDSLAKAISRWFSDPAYDREKVRRACFEEIDTKWTPQFQMKVLEAVIPHNV